MFPATFLLLLLPLVVSASDAVCVDSDQGYDTRQVAYFYNAFCEDLDIKGYVNDTQVYGFPMMSLGFQPAAGSLCDLNKCLGGFQTLVGDCQNSNNTIYGTGSYDAGWGIFNFTIGTGGVNALGTATNTAAVTTVRTAITSTICPTPRISSTMIVSNSSSSSSSPSSSSNSLTSTTILTTTTSITSTFTDIATLPSAAASSTTSSTPTITESSYSLTTPPYQFINSTLNSTTTSDSAGSSNSTATISSSDGSVGILAATTTFQIDTGSLTSLVVSTTPTGLAVPTFVTTSGADVVKAGGMGLLLVGGFAVVFL